MHDEEYDDESEVDGIELQCTRDRIKIQRISRTSRKTHGVLKFLLNLSQPYSVCKFSKNWREAGLDQLCQSMSWGIAIATYGSMSLSLLVTINDIRTKLQLYLSIHFQLQDYVSKTSNTGRSSTWPKLYQLATTVVLKNTLQPALR